MAPRANIPAAQYLRMSTEHQRYSLDSQARAIAAYAASNGFEVICSYVDAGVSGLDLEAREGLKQLLTDVIAGRRVDAPKLCRPRAVSSAATAARRGRRTAARATRNASYGLVNRAASADATRCTSSG